MNQRKHTTRRTAMALVAITASGCLAVGSAAPAVASTRPDPAHAAPATLQANPLGGLVRNVFQYGGAAIRPATRLSTRAPAELAENAGAARAAVGTADSASGSRFPRSAATAGRLATETTEIRLQRWAAEDGPEIFRETQCSLIWGQMYPDERGAVVNAEGLEPAGSQSDDPVLSASTEAIADAAVRRAARAAGRPVFVTTAWLQWAQGVQENAEESLGGDAAIAGLHRTVELEDAVVSLALLAYARGCLQPPSR